jgi:hypothetical protein
LNSRLDLGIRHLLPIYPFLYVMIAVALARYVPPAAWCAAVVLLAIESLSIYPHYLAFFNWPSGGPGNGPRYLVDSNIDWGQDTKKVKKYVDAHAFRHVCAAYFGRAYFGRYGVDEGRLPKWFEPQERAAMDCIAAVSVTLLEGVYTDRDDYRYLRELTPIAKVGYSIYMYDFRKRDRPLPDERGSATPHVVH